MLSQILAVVCFAVVLFTLAEFGWSVNVAPVAAVTPKDGRITKKDVLRGINMGPGSLEDIAARISTKPDAVLALSYHLGLLLKTKQIIREYTKTGQRVYSISNPLPPPPKYSYTLDAPRIIIAGTEEEPKQHRIERLRPSLAKYGWTLTRRDKEKTYVKWNASRVSYKEIILFLNDNPGASLATLAELAHPPEVDWTEEETQHAIANMRLNIYALLNQGNITKLGDGYALDKYNYYLNIDYLEEG